MAEKWGGQRGKKIKTISQSVWGVGKKDQRAERESGLESGLECVKLRFPLGVSQG